jgi:hypothetical protein
MIETSKGKEEILNFPNGFLNKEMGVQRWPLRDR